MMAQLSHITPFGRPGASIIGVRCDGFRAENSSERVLPQTSSSVKSSFPARTNTRAVMLFTLGLKICSLIADIWASSYLLSECASAGSLRRYGSLGDLSPDRLLVDDLTRLSIASAMCTSMIALSPCATRRLC